MVTWSFPPLNKNQISQQESPVFYFIDFLPGKEVVVLLEKLPPPLVPACTKKDKEEGKRITPVGFVELCFNTEEMCLAPVQWRAAGRPAAASTGRCASAAVEPLRV